MKLLENLARRARDFPQAPAVRLAGQTHTIPYSQFHARVQAVAAALRDRAPAGAVVMLIGENGPDFAAAFLGALAAGNSLLPLGPDGAEPELVAAAEESGAAVVLGDIPDFLRAKVSICIGLTDLPPAAAGPEFLGSPSSSLLLHSSGSTDRPKLIRRDGISLDAVAGNCAKAIGFGPDDRVLSALPLWHSYGMEHGLLAPIWAGSSVCLCQGFDPARVVREMEEGKITIFPGVPFMFEMLGRSSGGSIHLRRAYSAGAPLPGEVAEAFSRAFGTTVSQLYGATEIGSVTFSDPDLPGFDPASVGRAMDGVEIRIESASEDGEGQVAVRALSMLSAYADGESPELLDGFFLTGDLGRLDSHGNLTITGRLKLLIDVGGLKVNPLEVERVICQHPSVGECVIVPVRMSRTVCRLKAIVTPRQPGAAVDAEQLRQLVRGRLSSFKVPRMFEVRDTLPHSATGKVLRHLLETNA